MQPLVTVQTATDGVGMQPTAREAGEMEEGEHEEEERDRREEQNDDEVVVEEEEVKETEEGQKTRKKVDDTVVEEARAAESGSKSDAEPSCKLDSMTDVSEMFGDGQGVFKWDRAKRSLVTRDREVKWCMSTTMRHLMGAFAFRRAEVRVVSLDPGASTSVCCGASSSSTTFLLLNPSVHSTVMTRV